MAFAVPTLFVLGGGPPELTGSEAVLGGALVGLAGLFAGLAAAAATGVADFAGAFF